ncbi:MAG: hypothetical protein C4541_07695 [Candidatus Auribacter fodinae]|jgi:ABC-type Fe3+-hydroxamate transport system substrate-binding protein|uniref:Zinc ribbon domain-containing protein n=1 Tax=Candidatus Auribacter fodinae TaxID=2093366 RepID=A0A3A4R8I3_9BACT|nr:MAG: hypothetical protein C4541_07695 [Candidatus Auribacter fodinae]
MIKYTLILALIALSLSGCAAKKELAENSHETPQVVGEEAIEGTLGTIAATSDAARKVTDTTGAITEDVIIMSSDAVKNIIISLESLRKKSIETIGTKEVTYEVTGPYIMYCPYCGHPMSITREDSAAISAHTCPECKNEFLLNWKAQK